MKFRTEPLSDDDYTRVVTTHLSAIKKTCWPITRSTSVSNRIRVVDTKGEVMMIAIESEAESREPLCDERYLLLVQGTPIMFQATYFNEITAIDVPEHLKPQIVEIRSIIRHAYPLFLDSNSRNASLLSSAPIFRCPRFMMESMNASDHDVISTHEIKELVREHYGEYEEWNLNTPKLWARDRENELIFLKINTWSSKNPLHGYILFFENTPILIQLNRKNAILPIEIPSDKSAKAAQITGAVARAFYVHGIYGKFTDFSKNFPVPIFKDSADSVEVTSIER